MNATAFKILVILLWPLTLIAETSAPITFATYNIRNYASDEKRSNPTTDKTVLVKVLKETKADIIAVQEIVNGDDFQVLVKEQLTSYDIVLSECGGKGRQKLGFLYRKDAFKLVKFYEDFSIKNDTQCHLGIRPAAVGIFEQVNSKLKLAAVSVHLKAGGRAENEKVRQEQYKALGKLTNELRKVTPHISLMGDFNTTDYVLRNENYERFVDFVSDGQLSDSAEHTDCTSYWWGGVNDGLMHGSVLDHILVSESLTKSFKTQKVEVQAHCGKVACRAERAEVLGSSFASVSDHCPVVTTLQ